MQPTAPDRITASLIESHARKAAIRQATAAYDRDIFTRGMALGALVTIALLMLIKVAL